jgi:carboxyl-terminal processing protease
MRSRLTALTASACALILLVGVVTVAYQLGATAGGGTATAARTPIAASGTSDIGVVTELFERLRTEAVDAPADEVLVEGAIEGMLEALDDPYALYYDAAEFARFNRGLDGTFFGVGLLLEESPEGPTVVRTLPDTPAERAGIQEGEIIVSVDGEDVRDLPLSAIVDLVIGEEGTPVVLGFEGGPEGPREVELVRAQIDAPTIEAELLDDGSGLISLFTFNQKAAEQLRGAAEELIDRGAEGIILDLRRNPGGLLEEAVEVASVFVDDELIVTVRESDRPERNLRARRGGLVDVPLVVLVDDFSASASEIVAGAFQDLGRAAVVGETTFGKGTVQTVRTLSAGGGVKFTTAEYLTPSGDSIEGIGVVPDREVTGDEDAQLAAAQEALRQTIAEAAAR